jgi:hypothetical protein
MHDLFQSDTKVPKHKYQMKNTFLRIPPESGEETQTAETRYSAPPRDLKNVPDFHSGEQAKLTAIPRQ